MVTMRYKVWDKRLEVWRTDVIVDQNGCPYIRYGEDGLRPLWPEASEAMEVCRSLGIQDDTGEEIFENYIVSVVSIAKLYKITPAPLKVVLWNPKTASFTIRPRGSHAQYHIHGNRFENPELLERRA